MIARKQRIPIRLFPRNSGQTLRFSLFLIKLRKNELGYNRFGVIISAKQEPSAVGRHKIKRNILERAKRMPEKGLDMLFICTQGADKFKKIELDQVFNKISA